jgi:methionyl-tRNA formyltransferase
LKLAFLGTPLVAAQVLRALVDAGHDVRLVVTRRDARRGRGGQLSASPVKLAATELGLEVAYDPAAVAGSGADLGVVVSYGRIIKPELLALVPMVNLHFSLLPRWRGAAPVERAVLAGDRETGVCVMKLDEGLDTGPLYECQRVSIGDDERAEELRWRLGEVGTAMLLRLLSEGFPEPVPQSGEPTYAAKVGPGELHLDFALPSAHLLRVIRVGKAWTTFRGRRLIVHRARSAPAELLRDAIQGAALRSGLGGAATKSGQSRGNASARGPANGLGNGAGGHSARALAPGELAGEVVGTGDGGILLLEVQPEGKGRMSASEWLRGARVREGERLGE